VNPWIQVYGGQRYYPLNPTPDMVDINTIAHALANICRYNGHCAWHYSVAQHSVLVSKLCDKRDAKWGLLHDAAEAYVCDIARPVKDHPALAGYCEIEDRNMLAVCRSFGLAEDEPESVRLADKETALAIEARALMQPLDKGWAVWLDGVDVPAHVKIERLTPAEARVAFLSRWAELSAVVEVNPGMDAEMIMGRSDD
jgi:hypothetical protein